MPAYRTPEYEHLLEVERALSQAIKPRTNADGQVFEPEPRDIASIATALVRVIDQKRVMRGQGAPKPVEGRASKRNTRASGSMQPSIASVPTTPGAPSSTPTAGEAAAPPGSGAAQT